MCCFLRRRCFPVALAIGFGIAVGCSRGADVPPGSVQWLPSRSDALLALQAALDTINLDSQCVGSCKSVIFDPAVHLAPALGPQGISALPVAYTLTASDLEPSFPRMHLVLTPTIPARLIKRDTVLVTTALAPVQQGDPQDIGVILEINPPMSMGMFVFLVLHRAGERWIVIRRFSDQA